MSTQNDKPITPTDVEKVCKDLETKYPQVAIYIVPAEVTHMLSGGKGNDPIPVTFPFRKMPWEFREREMIEWNRRVLNDTAGDANMARAERAKRYQTAVRNRLSQDFTRSASVDPMLKKLRELAIDNGTPRKLAKDMTEKTLRNLLPADVVTIAEQLVKLQEKAAAAMKAARK